MFQRTLWVSLTQVFRSIALVLLPTSFLALLAWATAGSSSANTSDPMRAALWIWLGAHHIPFHVELPPAGQSGLMTYLPIGALLLPIFAIRSSFSRVTDEIEVGEHALPPARIIFSTLYAGIATLLAWVSSTNGVQPIIYFVPVVTGIGAWLVTSTVRPRSRRRLNESTEIAKRMIALGMGFASLALGISLFSNLSAVQNLATVLQPGFLGGILLFLINLAYLPNAIVATLAYFAGPGFAVGAHTLVSPWSYSADQIPALPILGAMPASRHPLVLICSILFVAMGAVLYNWTISQDSRTLVGSYLRILFMVAGISLLASGSLLTPAMSAVGVSVWKLTLAIGLELGVGIVLAMGLPRLLALGGKR